VGRIEEPKAVLPPSTCRCTGLERLKRVFGIEIERCDQCGGAVKIIASIKDPEVIAALLSPSPP
jgi:hypothetical protein